MLAINGDVRLDGHSSPDNSHCPTMTRPKLHSNLALVTLLTMTDPTLSKKADTVAGEVTTSANATATDESTFKSSDSPSNDLAKLRAELKGSLDDEEHLLKEQMQLLLVRRDLRAMVEQAEIQKTLGQLFSQCDAIGKTREELTM